MAYATAYHTDDLGRSLFGLQHFAGSHLRSIGTQTMMQDIAVDFLESLVLNRSCGGGHMELEEDITSADPSTSSSGQSDVKEDFSVCGEMAQTCLVDENSLLELFQVCPMCRLLSDVQKRRLGPVLFVRQRCPHCEFSRKWRSLPLRQEVPAGHPGLPVTDHSSLRIEKRNAQIASEPLILERFENPLNVVLEQLSRQKKEDLSDVQQQLVIKEEVPVDWSSNPECLKHEVPLITGQIKTEADGKEFGGKKPDQTTDPSSNFEHKQDGKCLKVFDSEMGLSNAADWQESWSDCKLGRHDPDWTENRASVSERGLFCAQRETTQDRNLRRQMLDKPFSCNVCARGFKRFLDLERHISVHTGEKPFDCDFCGKKFRLQKDLNSHKKIHTEINPFFCDVCGGQFVCQSSLRSHKRAHMREKPFNCEVCGRKFDTKAHFKRHTMVHTGEKPLTCDVCRKKFGLEHHLKRHMMVHKEEKPFRCELCGKSFRRRERLNKHMSLHRQEGDACFFVQNVNLTNYLPVGSDYGSKLC